jgi:RNA polymerase sigma-70 factor (ECF subfamily)
MGESMTESDEKQRSSTAFAKWFDAAQSGEVRAISQLLEAYRPLLLKLANAQLSPELRQKTPASDIVQNSLIKASLGFRQCEFQNIQDVAAWLQTILANEIATAFRRFCRAEKRDLRREKALDPAQLREWLEVLSLQRNRQYQGQLSRQEELEEIRRAIDRLPAHYRQVIHWRCLDELTFTTMANALDRSESAVRLLYGRAVNMLKQELSAKRET